MDTITCKKCKALLPSSFQFCPQCGRSTADPPTANRRRQKGNGSVYKVQGHRSKPWVAKFDGVVLGYFEERTDAEHFLADHRSSTPTLLNLTLYDIYERVLSSQVYLQQADRSRKNLQIAWGKLAVLGKKKARDIKTTDFQEVIDMAASNGCGRDGCAKIKSFASMLCQNAMLDDIMARDYSTGIVLPEKIEYVKRRNFTEDEIITLFYNDGDRIARIVLTMIYSALRLGELFDILKVDVNVDKRYMIGGSKTEAGRDRIIPIKEEIMPYILGFLAEPGEYLISTATGKQMHESNFRNRDFYPLLDRLGFQYKDEQGRNVLTPHRSRHTYISESIAAGVRPEVLKLVVGHASYSTSVERYGKDARLDFIQREVKKSF